MSLHSEGFFTGYQDYKLYFQSWEHTSSKNILIITHGQGEHSDCYQRVIEALKELPLSIYAWDLRGHGRSQGLRGYAEHFEDYCRDFECFLRFLNQNTKIKNKNKFLLAHSMGGLIQLKTLLDSPHHGITAQVLSAPLLGIAVNVPLYKEVGAAVLQSWLPKLTLNNEIRYSDLTRNPEVIAEYEKDTLRHDRISSGVYLGSQISFRYVKERANRLELPTLMQIPANDPVVSSEENRNFFHSLNTQDKKIIEYPDSKHEIYNDFGNEVVFADLKEFLLTHLRS